MTDAQMFWSCVLICAFVVAMIVLFIMRWDKKR